MNDRNSIKTLVGKTITDIRLTKEGNIMLFDQHNKPCLIAHYDELFDGNGNYFFDITNLKAV